MKPFAYRLTPAYRHGTDTPWGGDALRRVFGKDIPDDRTGESLEASTLDGLQSHTSSGQTLEAVAGGKLPLLLKLLDARETLSVQVHPGDAYAAAHENGKPGKTEAWVILRAEPGAKLVYGLKPGCDVRTASGKQLEAQLQWLSVREGDVLYIPSGLVHAVGAGILLYEIQQSSDVTYRFWDWDRRDTYGNPRVLHWDKACDVARADLQLSPIPGETESRPGGSVTHYLDTPYFTLDRYHVRGSLPIEAAGGFQYITALGAGLLCFDGETMPFQTGETFYIPPGIAGISASGTCDLLVSAESRAKKDE